MPLYSFTKEENNMSNNMENELFKEVFSLRKQLKELSTPKEAVSLSSFSTKDLKNKLKIIGVLLAEGTWGGIYWGGEEIKKMVKKRQDLLDKMELTAEHEKDDSWGNKQRGYHEKVTYNNKLKAAIYEGIIDDSKAIDAIKDGFFRATSMRVKFTPKFVDGRKIATDLEPINNTLTAYPACKTCSIFNWKELSDNGDSIEYFGVKEKDLNKDNISYSTDVNNMASNSTEFEDINLEEETDLMTKHFELKSDLVGVLPDVTELGEKEGVIKLELMTEDEAIARNKSIVYYFPEGKYRNRARHIVRRKVNGEFSYYPLYRSGQPIPYTLLSRPIKKDEATVNNDNLEEVTTEGEEVNEMSESVSTEEASTEGTDVESTETEETETTEETTETAEVVEPVKHEVVIKIEVPKPEPVTEASESTEETSTEETEEESEETTEEESSAEEEATIVETPTESVTEETEKEPFKIEDWSTPEKAADVLLFREKKPKDEY